MTKSLLPLLIVGLTCLSACGDGGQEPVASPDTQQTDTSPDLDTPSSECEFLDDGVCDEPVNCPLGTDSNDCKNACDDPKQYWLLGAACAHRTPPNHGPNLPAAVNQGALNQRGYVDRTIDVTLGEGDGTRGRHYRLYVPPHYDPALAWPLVIMMPGHRVDIYTLANYTHLESTAEANNFLLLYAEQEWRISSFRWAWWSDWNWVENPDSNPDVSFLTKLVDDVAENWSINRKKVYGVGHSRGGAMAYIAAFELSNLFAAICSQSGFTEFGYSSHVEGWSGRRTPTMLVHGTLDSDVNVAASDAMNSQLKKLGWTPDNLVYHRLENVAHRWQPWLNQRMWDFLNSHELPTEVTP